jgi:hypothetical protein
MDSVVTYKIVSDDRKPIIIKHDKICYPSAVNQKLVDRVDTSYPGIVIDFNNGFYLLEDGVHRISKLQQQGIFESLFYVVSINEYKNGIVHMIFDGKEIILGEWSNNALNPISHKTII